MLGQQNCSLECIACLDLVLWLWYCCFWGGRIHLLRGGETVMQRFGWCRSVQMKQLGSYDIGQEICKWQCVHCSIVYWEWGCWLTFFVDFHTFCFENGWNESHFTIIIAIHCILVSLDSVWRSFGAWHDNIRWLALQIWSSLVLHTLGENLEMKNDNFSRSRVI